MTAFEYRRPQTLQDAFELLALPGAAALAGGTDLLVALRHRQPEPTMVVDLKAVTDLGAGIVVDGGSLLVGGRCILRRIIDDELVNRHFPVLVEAASVVGSVQIRNRATLAGNLCNASPAADTVPALLAYGADVIVSGPGGDRVVPIPDFFVGPGVTVLAPGEVVTAVRLPIPKSRLGAAFARVTRRRGVDLASVNLACVVEPSGTVRFGFGAVGPTPILAKSSLEDLGDAEGWSRLLAATSPISDIRASARYRQAMLRVHSQRALRAATDSLPEAS